jgi:hypothetical protein
MVRAKFGIAENVNCVFHTGNKTHLIVPYLSHVGVASMFCKKCGIFNFL